jgi:hypothetical protein
VAASTNPKTKRAVQADTIRFLFKFFKTYFSRLILLVDVKNEGRVFVENTYI